MSTTSALHYINMLAFIRHYKTVPIQLFFTSLYLICPQLSIAQHDLPIVKSTSKTIDIRDGTHYKEGYWIVMPQKNPDYYYTDFPKRDHQVTFITDIDSISFNVSYGNTYDFIVLLNNRDSCYTRISATYHGISRYTKDETNAERSSDTLEFFMRNSRIFFEGTMNGNQDITFQFDLGAGMSNINYTSVDKAGVDFDGSTTLINSDGVNEAPTSSSNSIDISGLHWDNVPFVQTKNMRDDEDAIIGNSLFRYKVIEINYDDQIVVLHDTIPHLTEEYSKHDIIYDQHRPLVKADIKSGGHIYTDWFLFDTGWDGPMVLRDKFFRKNNAWGQLRSLPSLRDETIKIVPHLGIGGREFTDVLSPAYSPDETNTGRHNILGNELLNHFNVILDNHNGFIYLNPNTLQSNSYENLRRYYARALMICVIGIALITALVYLIKAARTKRIK